MTIGMIGREGVDIEYENVAAGEGGQSASAYLAKPPSGVGCGIVVIHDEWGLSDFTRDACDRLARAGFVALAPDLFHGRRAEDRESARQLAKELDVDSASEDLESAVSELFNQNATTGSKVGALGFGLGGSLALLASSRHRRIGAVVDLYGSQPALISGVERLAAAVLAVFAGEDESVTESSVAAFQATLERAGARASVELKPGVHSGYVDDSRLGVYDAITAEATWDALLAFFRSELA